MRPRRWEPLRAALVVAAALLLQLALVADVRVGGVMPDLVLVVVVAAALTGGPDRGATYGFATGLLYDLVVSTPFGLTPLTYALVGYAVGRVGALVQRTSGWWPVLLAATAGAAQVVLYTSLGNLVGVAYPFADVPAIALVVAAGAALGVLPLMRALWWAHGHDEPDRLEVLFR
ncbi:MAG TPA: rod shape-determining protein MreD [Acidimicrobiales bacterium]